MREKTPLSSNIFLSSDIVFDIDRSPFSYDNLELARKDTLRVLAFCQDQAIPVKYIAFSGSKGFHIIGTDTRQYGHENPTVREDMAKEVRKKIVARALAEGIRFDAKITTDTRRIIRVPGTINSKTGFICTVLSLDQISQPLGKMLKYIPRVNAVTPVIPSKGDESPLRGSRIISWLRNRFGVRSKPYSTFSYATYLVNAVPGIDRQIPFFVYPARRNQGRIENELIGIQERYGLSDIYLYRSDTETSAVCFRTFPLRRIEKIIGASSSANFGTIIKYKQLFFRVGEVSDENLQEIASAPRYEKTLEAPVPNNEQFISLPHREFFTGLGLSVRHYPRQHGLGAVTMTHAIIEK
jgi:hypothetical protein